MPKRVQLNANNSNTEFLKAIFFNLLCVFSVKKYASLPLEFVLYNVSFQLLVPKSNVKQEN